MIDLKEKHILIVGGSRGIGAATAKLAAELGARVSLTYASRPNPAEKLVSEIRAAGGEAKAIKAEVTSEASMNGAVKEAIDTYGKINGMVVTAGIFEGKNLEDMTEDFWDRTMEINLKGTFISVKACLDSLKAAGKSSLVIFSSTAGQRGSDVFSAYATSKGGQIMFMRSMARELAQYGIRSNCVAPGWTETEMATESINEFGREEIIESIPLGRIGRPEDPARAAIFLLSDAAEFITGSTITVDGGMDMRG
jgi:3-oxoacyl-[acyl-carrier protein] reductase